MPITNGNRPISTPGLTVHQADDLGIEPFPEGRPWNFSRRSQQINKVLLHWTGGENSNPRTVRDTLVNRNAGAHFFVDFEGVITQFLDVQKATTHAAPTATTIGIEIQNKGLNRGTRQGTRREVYEVEKGGRTVEYLTFTTAQKTAVKRLCRILCSHFSIPYVVPTDSDGTLTKELMSSPRIQGFSGILGHYHTSHRGKHGPGYDLLQEIHSQPSGTEGEAEAVPRARSGTRRPQPTPQEEEEILERTQALTHGRTETPAERSFNYGIVTTEEDASTKDPHVASNAGIDISITRNLATAPYEKWFNQMTALRQVTNLDLAQSVPVIQILVREGNDLINLNERIFGASTFKNMFESKSEFEDRHPERPIASIDGWSVDIQSPSAGGGESQIAIGKLSLKIHNPFLVNKDHPHGKYISYMMRASYAMRIRFGVSPDINSQTNDESVISEALQWSEQDYYVAQHEVGVADDLSVTLKLTLNPGEMKLFNQVVIGESMPVEAADIEVQSIAASQGEGSRTHQDVQAVITRATNVSGTYGGINTHRRPDGTLSSVLQGASRNIDTILSPDGPENIQARRENLVNALKSLQSRFLTSRMENLFSGLSYLYTRPGEANLQYVAVNTGPLIDTLVKPELEYIINFIAQNDLRMGTIYSTQRHQSGKDHSGVESPPPPARTNIKMIFGNFNDRAGQWRGEPISTFPLNVDDLLAYTRVERDVGRFNGSINDFINRVHTLIANGANYIVQGDSPDNRLATPIIKYLFYPDPEDPTSWVFYLYDQKQRAVGFSQALREIGESEGRLTRDDIKSLCERNRIPWLEPGLDSSLIRTMNASTAGDDTITSHLMVERNAGFNSRQLDGSSVPSGISREFVHGLQMNLNDHIAKTDVLLPLQLTIDHYISVTAVLFGHVYIFFPLKQFSSLYSIQQLSHEVQNGRASTKMSLIIQVTQANRSAD